MIMGSDMYISSWRYSILSYGISEEMSTVLLFFYAYLIYFTFFTVFSISVGKKPSISTKGEGLFYEIFRTIV